MSSKITNRIMAGGALSMALAAALLGAGSASAASLTTDATLAASGTTAVSAGTMMAIQGSAFQDDEAVSFWINVPDGTVVSPDALGQSDTEIVDTVVPLDNMISADDSGTFTYSLDTSGLPSGNYSLVAHGLQSGDEQVLMFSVTGGPAVQLTASGSTSVAAGTILTITGSAYENDEPIGLWVNVPDSASISQDSLGQTDSEIVDNVIGLDTTGYADDGGTFTYSLDTTGLPSGNYSLVAHGLQSGIDRVLMFTIK